MTEQQLFPSFPEVESSRPPIDEPELTDYATWAAENPDEQDEIKKRVQYSDSVRQKYIEHGSYADSRQAQVIESELMGGLAKSLVEDGLVDAEDTETLNSLGAPAERSFDDKMSMVISSNSSDSEAWNVATRYLAHQKALQKGAPEDFENPLIQERTDQLRQEAEQLIEGGQYDEALRKAVDRGELSMANLKDKEGNQRVHTGPALNGMSFADAMKQAVSSGNMSYSQAAAAAQMWDTPEGMDIPLYQVQQYEETLNAVEAFSTSDPDFNRFSQRLQNHYKVYDEGDTDLSPEQRENKLTEITSDLYTKMLATDAFEEGEEPSFEAFRDVTSYMSKSKNFHSSEAVAADDEDVASNIQRIGYGPLQMRDSALYRKDIFEATLRANPELSDQQKNQFEGQRTTKLINGFEKNNKLLERSSISDDWNAYKQRELTKGLKNHEILDNFINDPENYDVLDESMGGTWASVGEGFSTLGGAVSLAVGSALGAEGLEDWGRKALIEDMEQAANRREVASLMGEEYGMTRSVVEGIAPVLVDMGATALLTFATLPAAGAGGMLYLAAKASATTGARLTAKGLAKNLVTSTLRASTTDGMELAAEKLVTQGLIKGSSKVAKEKGAMEVVKSYNKLYAKNMGGARMAGFMLPAMNRSGGSTYASIYSTLGADNPDMSHEEKHDKALGGGLAAASFTGGLVGGFSKLGIPLLDNALAGGATGKQIRKILGPLVSRGDDELSEGAFRQLGKKILEDMAQSHTGLKNLAKGMVKGALGEFPEEALDQLANGFVEDAATGRETPLLERMNQAFMAGLQGAILGAGMPAATYVAGATNANQRLREEAPRVMADFRTQLTTKLNETGSPITEQVVGNLLSLRAQDQDTFLKRFQSRADEVKSLQADVKAAGKARASVMEEQASDATTFQFAEVDTMIPEGTTIANLSDDQRSTYYSLAAVRDQLQQQDVFEPEFASRWDGDQMVFEPTKALVFRTRLEFSTEEDTIPVGTPLRDLTLEQYERYGKLNQMAAGTVGLKATDLPSFEKIQESRLEPRPSQSFDKPSPEGVIPEVEAPTTLPAPTRVSELKENTYISDPTYPEVDVTPDSIRNLGANRDEVRVINSLGEANGVFTEEQQKRLVELNAQIAATEQVVQKMKEGGEDTPSPRTQHMVVRVQNSGEALQTLYPSITKEYGGLLNDFSTITQEDYEQGAGVLPKSLGRASKVVTMMDENGGLYYMLGALNTPLSELRVVRKTEALEAVVNQDEAPAVVAFPHSDLKGVRQGTPLESIIDPNQLRLLEQAALKNLGVAGDQLRAERQEDPEFKAPKAGTTALYNMAVEQAGGPYMTPSPEAKPAGRPRKTREKFDAIKFLNNRIAAEIKMTPAQLEMAREWAKSAEGSPELLVSGKKMMDVQFMLKNVVTTEGVTTEETTAATPQEVTPYSPEAARQLQYVTEKLRSMDEPTWMEQQIQEVRDGIDRDRADFILKNAEARKTAYPATPRQPLTPEEKLEVERKAELGFIDDAETWNMYTRQWERNNLLKPEGYLTAGEQQLNTIRGELSDEALKQLVPLETIDESRIPAIRDGLVSSREELQQRQVEILRDLIYQGYPVTINSNAMRGVLPQSEAPIGGFNTMVDLPDGAKRYHAYFTQSIAERINQLYPTIDLTGYELNRKDDAAAAKERAASKRDSTRYIEFKPANSSSAGQVALTSKTYNRQPDVRMWTPKMATKIANDMEAQLAAKPKALNKTQRNSVIAQIKNLRQQIRTARPPLEVDLSKGIHTQRSATKTSYTRVNEDGSLTRFQNAKLNFYINGDGVGIFNNDPVMIGEMLANNVPVKIPMEVLNNMGDNESTLSRSMINPSIKYDNKGNVYRVVRPTADGKGFETVVHESRKSTTMPDLGSGETTAAAQQIFNPSSIGGVLVTPPSEAKASGMDQSNNFAISEGAKGQVKLFEVIENFRQWYARASRSDRSKPANYMAKLSGISNTDGRGITPAEYDFFVTSFNTEYEFLLVLHGARKELTPYITDSNGEPVLAPTNEDKAFDRFMELVDSDVENTAKILGKRMGIARDSYDPVRQTTKAERDKLHKTTILSFIRSSIVDNKKLTVEKQPRVATMPTMSQVATTIKSRIKTNRETVFGRDVLSSSVSLQSMPPEVAENMLFNESITRNDISVETTASTQDPDDFNNLNEQVSAISESNPLTLEQREQLSMQFLNDSFTNTIDQTIEAIQTPDNQAAFIDLLRRTIHLGSAKRDEDYKVAEFPRYWHQLSSSLVTATNEHAGEMMTFIKGLKLDSIESQLDLRSNLKMILFPQDVTETQLQRMHPTLVRWKVSNNFETSRAILNDVSAALRSVYAMTAITSEQRPQAIAQNTAEATRLGLVDNDPSSVVAALAKIREESSHDNHRLVAELLLEDTDFISQVKFFMGEGTDTVPARYDKMSDGSHEVYINLAGHNGRGLENVLLEEYVHAFLSDVINKPDASLTPAQRQAVQRLRGLMQIAKKQFEAETNNNPDIVQKSISYAFSNMDDFAASFLLNPDLQSYIKSIETPSNQRGMFKRIIDSIVSMFRRAIGAKKLTKEESVTFVEAMEELVDLTRSRASDVRPDLNTSLAHALSESAKDGRARADSSKALRDLNPSLDTPVTPPSQDDLNAIEEAAQEEESNRQSLQEQTVKTEAAFTDVPVSALGGLSSMTTEELQDYVVNEALPFIRAHTPPEMRVVVDTTLSNKDGEVTAAAARGNVVYINPYGLANMIADITGDGKNNGRSIQHSLLAVLSEEVGHYGAFNQFTLAEVDAMGETLGRDELGVVAAQYYRTPEALKNALERLDSFDPAIVQGETRNLVDEHLRMQGQRTMRGFITEEDLAFYRTNPSSLKMLKRYMQGFLRTLVTKFKTLRNKDFMVGRVNRLVAEIRQIEAGYRPQPSVHAFDPNNPEMSFAAMGAMLDDPMTKELERALGFMDNSNLFDSPESEARATSAGSGLGSQDSTYLEAVEAGDTETAQAMVDAAANDAGYVEEMYHGTISQKNFNKFREKQSGIWLAADEANAQPSGGDAPARVMRLKADLGEFPVTLSPEDYADWQASPNPMKWLADFRNFKWRQGNYTRPNPASFASPTAVKVGDYATVVFNSNQLKSGEPITKTAKGNVIPLSERFDTAQGDLRYTSAGLPSVDLSLDFGHVPTKYELPMMHAGEYTPPKGLLRKMLLWDADPRITRLYKSMRDHHRGSEETLKRMQTEFIKIQNKDYGKDRSKWPAEDIATAVGTTEGLELNADTSTRIEDAYDAEITAIKANKSLSESDAAAMKVEANRTRQQQRGDAMKLRARAFKQEQELAINRINKQSPALATHIAKMRGLVDQLSALLPKYYKLTDQDGVATTLGLKIDSNQGIYITRTYKMFTEVGYHKQIRDQMINPQTEQYRNLRDRAQVLFDDMKLEQMTKQEADKLQEQNPDMSEDMALELGEVEAKRWMDANPEAGQAALLDFIDSYHNPNNNSAIRQSDGYAVLVENLKQRKSDAELPEVLRELLGENTNLEDGVANLLNTYATVASMVSNQAYLYNIATVGQGKHVKGGVPLEDKFLLTPDEYKASVAENPEKYNEWEQDSTRVSIHDPLRGLYAPTDFWKDLAALTKRGQFEPPETAAGKAMLMGAQGLSMATGSAMAFKTLGSTGFYIRNALGNPLFFAPMQGNFNMGEMAKQAWDQLKRTVLTLEDTDTALQKYYDLGILGTNLRTNVMRDLLQGKTRISDVRTALQDIEKKHGTIDSIRDKIGKAGVVVSGPVKGLQEVYRKATELADAADAFYKIAYFEAEMKTLRKAVEAAEPNTSFYKVSEDVLEKEAADMVQQTSQMSTQRWPIIEKLSQSPFGLAFAPYLGFTGDVFRIPFNTFRLAKKQVGSDNSVIRARGYRRFFGMGVVTVATAGVPAMVSSLLGDLDEEDRYMLRKSAPDFAKRSTPIYYKWDGQLMRLSLTYVNPFSPIYDPFTTGYSELIRGNVGKAASDVVSGLFLDTFGNEQILFGTAMQLKRNRDEQTGRPIYDEATDDFMDVMGKSLKFLYEGAYQTRIEEAIKESIERRGLDSSQILGDSRGRLLQELLPAKPQAVDLEASFNTYKYKMKSSTDESKRDTFSIFSSTPMSSESVADVYNEHYDDMYRINSNLYRATLAYEKMGIARWKIRNSLIKSGYGKKRTDNLMSGVMLAPSISPTFMQDLAGRGLIDRANPYYGAKASSPYMRILGLDD